MENPLDDLYWRDEILQILYWLRGEGLVESASPQDLVTFLEAEEQLVSKYLDQLVEEGFVERILDSDPRYQLTAFGIQEGGRRFAEEFAGLTNQGHGECNDPDCFCKTQGPQACAAHTAHSH